MVMATQSIEFPAAYCHTCERWLSPHGSHLRARDAMLAHHRDELNTHNCGHYVGIYASRDQRDETHGV